VSFAAITLCVASQRVFIVVVYFVMTQSGNLWIHPHVESLKRRHLSTLEPNLHIGRWKTLKCRCVFFIQHSKSFQGITNGPVSDNGTYLLITRVAGYKGKVVPVLN